jgi:hypothetical protein
MPTFVLGSISLRSVLFATLLFLIPFSVSLAIVSFILIRIPPDYFHKDRPREFLADRSPFIRALAGFGKNLLGVLLVALGIVMSVPGVPGQGILTILLGIMLLDFPRKRDLEYKLVSRPPVFQAINKLRQRFGKPGLVLD